MIHLHDCANPECGRQIRVKLPDSEQPLTLDFTEVKDEIAFQIDVYVCSEACREAIEGTFEEV